MKKFFDKHIAQSSKGQISVLAVVFVVLVFVGGIIGRVIVGYENDDNIRSFGRPELWGVMQCVDGGFVQATISNNTKTDGSRVKEPASFFVIALSLGFWLGGLILVSFFTGSVTDFLNARREKILSGSVDYSFKRNYILIVGFDFQVKNLIRRLLAEYHDCQIVLITHARVDEIYADMTSEFEDADDLTADEIKRLFVMRRDISFEKTYQGFRITAAREIYLVGDADSQGRDGKTLRTLEILSKRAQSERVKEGTKPVKVYMHIEDSMLYSQVRSMEHPADKALRGDGLPIFDLEIYNYFESWAWECWSHLNATDGVSTYLPLRHKSDSQRVELFVIGAGRMGRSMVNYAMPLMNYGDDKKSSRITVFDPDATKRSFFSDRETLDSLPEVEVRFCAMDGCSDEANDQMLAAISRKDTSVTIVIALSDPDYALRTYSELSNKLRRENVSVLIWQATSADGVPNKMYLKMGGMDSNADNTIIRYFGMTDKLPWKDSSRFEYGMAVNYFYNYWVEDAHSPDQRHQDPANRQFLEQSKQIWEEFLSLSSRENVPNRAWGNTARWRKWSSVNSGDTFKEKAMLFKDLPYTEAVTRVLRAEHNRWWTERLLSGWRYDSALSRSAGSRNNRREMLHGDMIPFDQLPESEKEKDKINIAAMSAFDFIA